MSSRQSCSLGAVVASAQVRRLVIATELAAVATLLNPYGWNLHREILTFADNPNLQSLAEWDPLTLRDYPGQAMAVVVIELMWLYRQTPRRVSDVRNPPAVRPRGSGRSGPPA